MTPWLAALMTALALADSGAVPAGTPPKPSAKPKAAAARGPRAVWERVRGEVYALPPKGKPVALSAERPARKGDRVATSREASVTLAVGSGSPSRARLARATIARWDGARKLALELGHARVLQTGGAAALSVTLPGGFEAKSLAPKGEAGEWIASVSPSEATLAQVVAETRDLPDDPRTWLSAAKDGYVQVAVVTGPVEVRSPKGKPTFRVLPGEVLRIRQGTPDFAPASAGVDETRRLRDLFPD